MKIGLFFPSFLMFFCSFVYIDNGTGIGRKIQAVGLFLLALYCMPKMRGFVSKSNPYRNVNFLVLLYGMFLVISSYMSSKMDYSYIKLVYGREWLYNDYEASSWVLSGFYFGAILLPFAYVEYVCRKGLLVPFVNSIKRVLIVYLLIVYIKHALDIIGIETGFDVGGKFIESYYHVLFLSLYIFEKILKKQTIEIGWMYLLFVWSLLYSLFVYCLTGFVATLIFGTLFMWTRKKKHIAKMFSWKILLVLLSFNALFIITYIYIENSEILNGLLVQIGKDGTIASRFTIYEVALPLLFVNGLWGVGAGNSTHFFTYLFDYPNAQNGLIDVVISDGIFTVAVMLIMFFYLIRKNLRNKGYLLTYPVVMLLVTYISVSSIEVTLGTNFTCLFPLLITGIKPSQNLLYEK